jgi:hypothetical protein
MENNGENIKIRNKKIYLLSEGSKKEIKQINIKDSNDNIYAVVTPVNNMDYF